MTLNEWNPASSTWLYHLAIASLVASFMVFLEKIILKECDSPYAFFISGNSLKRISACSRCLWVHFSPDLKSR